MLWNTFLRAAVRNEHLLSLCRCRQEFHVMVIAKAADAEHRKWLSQFAKHGIIVRHESLWIMWDLLLPCGWVESGLHRCRIRFAIIRTLTGNIACFVGASSGNEWLFSWLPKWQVASYPIAEYWSIRHFCCCCVRWCHFSVAILFKLCLCTELSSVCTSWKWVTG